MIEGFKNGFKNIFGGREKKEEGIALVLEEYKGLTSGQKNAIKIALVKYPNVQFINLPTGVFQVKLEVDIAMPIKEKIIVKREIETILKETLSKEDGWEEAV